MSADLHIAVVHHHLKSGGVTRVIKNAAAALRESHPGVKFGVLTGASSDKEGLLTHEIPELGYQTEPNSYSPADLLSHLREGAKKCLGRPPDLWHFHNHSLGKNPTYTAAAALLAEAGEPLLLQIHDFAEDGRPENYRVLCQEESLPRRLYPVGPRVGYGVLNGRDHQHLRRAGLSDDRLFLLPNPIHAEAPPRPEEPFQEWDPAFAAYQTLVLYPVRATRRKNFGEILLWAMRDTGQKSPTHLPKPLFISSLGTTNPDFDQTFGHWQDYANRHQLPVRLAFGESSELPFDTLVGAADAILTTSIAEGFGLGFLEPWLMGKPLLGRNIPEITRDFTEAGIHLGELYDRIDIPLEWIGGRQPLEEALKQGMQSACRDYGRPFQTQDLDRALDAFLREDCVDFGRLHEPFQEDILDYLHHNPEAFTEIVPDKLPAPARMEDIEKNACCIRKNYSLSAYGDHLFQIYDQLVNAPHNSTDATSATLNPDRVLDQFLQPESFNLLRSQ